MKSVTPQIIQSLSGMNIRTLDWTSALCRQVDPELFYPDEGFSPEPAKAICRSCDLIDQCRTWAMDNDEPYGVWGGLSERERARSKEYERTSAEVAA